MDEGGMGMLWFVALALVAAFAGVVLLVLHLLRVWCPACLSEFRQEDGGPLIPKAAWDAGTRHEIPRAKVHR